MRDTVKRALIEALTEVQECSGRPTSTIDDQCCPIGGLEGFDSLNAVETASLLSGQLGYKVSPKLLLSNNPHQPLTVNEIVERVTQAINGEQGGP